MNSREAEIQAMMVSAQNGRVDVTILVKALNEEQHIEACLRSALESLGKLPGLTGEVLLVDSVSTDRTVEIAARLGVRIVQFDRTVDRGCGAALQLGYQYASGSYLYVLDGDMQLIPTFLATAYKFLQENPDVGGVGGRLRDTHIRTEADRKRDEYYSGLHTAQQVTALGGGGLYRREAIDRVGYLSNRWLPAFEEVELGVRLRNAGYRLIRLSDTAVLHTGHAETSLQMLHRLWRSRRIDAVGMFLRSALGKPWFAATLKLCWFIFAAPMIWLVAGLLLAAGVAVDLPLAGLVMVPIVVWTTVLGLLSWRKRSISAALLGMLSWHVYTFGGARGFLRELPDPTTRIAARELDVQPRSRAH